ncbi:hypothetical protein L345_00322, partial [Ophiophagus hannah]
MVNRPASIIISASQRAGDSLRLATGCLTPVLSNAGTWSPARYSVGIGWLAALLNIYVRMSDDRCCICSCCIRTVPGAQLSCALFLMNKEKLQQHDDGHVVAAIPLGCRAEQEKRSRFQPKICHSSDDHVQEEEVNRSLLYGTISLHLGLQLETGDILKSRHPGNFLEIEVVKRLGLFIFKNSQEEFTGCCCWVVVAFSQNNKSTLDEGGEELYGQEAFYRSYLPPPSSNYHYWITIGTNIMSYPSKRPGPINLLPRSIRLLILTHKPILSSLELDEYKSLDFVYQRMRIVCMADSGSEPSNFLDHFRGSQSAFYKDTFCLSDYFILLFPKMVEDFEQSIAFMKLIRSAVLRDGRGVTEREWIDGTYEVSVKNV